MVKYTNEVFFKNQYLDQNDMCLETLLWINLSSRYKLMQSCTLQIFNSLALNMCFGIFSSIYEDCMLKDIIFKHFPYKDITGSNQGT